MTGSGGVQLCSEFLQNFFLRHAVTEIYIIKTKKVREKKSSGFVLYIIVILTLKIHCRAALPTSGHGS
jgi:hypothetical protein